MRGTVHDKIPFHYVPVATIFRIDKASSKHEKTIELHCKVRITILLFTLSTASFLTLCYLTLSKYTTVVDILFYTGLPRC